MKYPKELFVTIEEERNESPYYYYATDKIKNHAEIEEIEEKKEIAVYKLDKLLIIESEVKIKTTIKK